MLEQEETTWVPRRASGKAGAERTTAGIQVSDGKRGGETHLAEEFMVVCEGIAGGGTGRLLPSRLRKSYRFKLIGADLPPRWTTPRPS